jgi:hypothetical protein
LVEIEETFPSAFPHTAGAVLFGFHPKSPSNISSQDPLGMLDEVI